MKYSFSPLANIPHMLGSLQEPSNDKELSSSSSSSIDMPAKAQPLQINTSTPASKLMKSPELFKESKRSLMQFLEGLRHGGHNRYYIPWYFRQTTKDLVQSFHIINRVEDERLHEAVMLGEKSTWSLHASAKSYEQGRSRYTNVFPWDKNRVRLPVRSNDFSDYINASYIKLSIPEISSYNRYYIATQGPTENTVPHFWQMCYNESDPTDADKPIVIVMVTAVTENRVQKCYKYWPDGTNYDGFMLHTEDQHDEGFKCSLSLSLDSRHDNGDYVYSRLLLSPHFSDLNSEIAKSFKPKIVHHFYYDKWGDFSKPDGYATILEISQSAWKLNNDPNVQKHHAYNTNPLYVHCSAGVGRSGTFITLDYLLNYCSIFTQPVKKITSSEDLSDLNNTPDPIKQIVESLRSQRMMLVQSKSQFLFAYDTAELVYQDKIVKALLEEDA